MLTSDQLRVRRSGSVLTPRFLQGKARERLLPVAQALVAAVEAGKGERREEVDARLSAIEQRFGGDGAELGEDFVGAQVDEEA